MTMVNILGLRLYNGVVMDLWWLKIAHSLDKMEEKIFSPEGLDIPRETATIEREIGRMERGGSKAKRYKEALIELSKIYPEMASLAKRRRRQRWYLNNADRRVIALYFWHALGNKISGGDLNPEKLSFLLRRNGFVYCFQGEQGKGWYRNGMFAAKIKVEVLEQIEQTQPVNRLELI